MTASVSVLKKLVYQILINAKITGMFLSSASDLKCVSILLAPNNSLLKFSKPTDKLIDKPTALQSENLPPTQSQIGKICDLLIPKLVTFSIFVDTATKCLEIVSSLVPKFLDSNQSLIVVALLSVS